MGETLSSSEPPHMNAPTDPRIAERADELYWSSERSVNDIAEELELSKGALYALIRPHPAGLLCPRCGGEMEYPNRTAKKKRLVTCHACGREIGKENAEAGGHESERSLTTPSPGRYSARVVVGAALLGTAAGYLVARLTRRSR